MGELLKLHLPAGEALDDPPGSGEAEQETPVSAGGEGGAPAALSPPPGARMGYLEQAWNTVAQAARTLALHWRTARAREGGLPHAAYHGQADSVAKLDEYTRSRAWVQTGRDGSVEELVVVLWGRTIGWFLTALGQWIAWTGNRWLRGTLTFLIVFAAVLIGLVATGHEAAALQLAGALAGITVAGYLILAFVAGRRHREAFPPDEEDGDL